MIVVTKEREAAVLDRRQSHLIRGFNSALIDIRSAIPSLFSFSPPPATSTHIRMSNVFTPSPLLYRSRGAELN